MTRESDIKKALTSMLEDIMEEKKKAETHGDRTRKALVNMLEDIKEQKDEIEKTYKELKETTAVLIQSEKMTALGELTAGVAHELNQPLNAIKIISQDISRDITKARLNQDQLPEDISDIIGQVNKMAGIIDHMRIFTRKTEGLLVEKTDINVPVEGVFKFLNKQLEGRNIEVTKELGKELYIVGDAIRLEQVFMNLVVNARDEVEKLKNKKEMKIWIKTYSGKYQLEKTNNKQSSSSNCIIVEVKDNGRGIPDNLKEKIFEQFYTTKSPGMGTGLGLSVTNQIIKEHKGRIEVESKIGEGSIFRVIFPVAD